MGYSKVVINGATKIDLTQDTVSSGVLVEGYTAHDKAGDPVEGSIPVKTSDSVTESEDGKVVIPAGYYKSEVQFTPSSAYVERSILTSLSDPNGEHTFNQDLFFTMTYGASITLLIDYDFSGEDAANLICIGNNPSAWNYQCIRFYIASSNEGTGFVLWTYSTQENIFDNTGTVNMLGHHKLVIKCSYGDTKRFVGWFDGKKIGDATDIPFYEGSWAISNAEGPNRFKGTYNEISVLRNDLTDEELLKISSLLE